jgi:two-component system nitrate/nitrite response regulator NarL
VLCERTKEVRPMRESAIRLVAPVAVSPVTVVVVVPNELMRFGMTALLESVPSVSEAHFCAEIGDAERVVRTVRPQVLVSCVGPGLSDEDDVVFGRICALGVKILSVLPRQQQERIMAAADLLADGYLLDTDLTAAALEDMVPRLLLGEMPISNSLMRLLVTRVRGRREAMMRPALTPREQEVLSLLAQGLSNKQIARRLGISPHGAKRHVANVLAKLNCPNRTLAVAHALRAGLIEDVRS